MRFSLKWALAAMAYVALAMAAFTYGNWLCVELLWTVSVLAVCYATLCALFACGVRRASAAGFALVSTIFVACLFIVPNRMPIRQLLAAAYSTEPTLEQLARGYAEKPIGPNAMRRAKLNFEIASGTAPQAHAANAIGTMLAGLVGCGLGALAYRRGRGDG